MSVASVYHKIRCYLVLGFGFKYVIISSMLQVSHHRKHCCHAYESSIVRQYLSALQILYILVSKCVRRGRELFVEREVEYQIVQNI